MKADVVKSSVRHASAALRMGLVLPLGLAIRAYGSTDKWLHGYHTHYEKHFQSRRMAHGRLLEIGVGGYENRKPGGSLRVWRDHFPRYTIVGFDLHEKEVHLGDRVRFVRGDQSDPAALDRAIQSLGGPPTIVIDDGSHLAEHAAATFGHLFPQMPSGALYVIEDLHTSYWPDFGGAVPPPDRTAIGFIHRLLDDVQSRDSVFARKPHLGRPTATYPDIRAIHLYPGIVFIEKA